MSDDLIQITGDALDMHAALRFVTDPSAGGIDVFLGTTRSEESADGRDLIALDYEAYGEMALKQMRDLASRARERWPVSKLAILHRTGRVKNKAASWKDLFFSSAHDLQGS